MKLKKHLLILLLALLLAGCGFHLRGMMQLPPQLQTLYVTGNSPYSALIKELQQSLRMSDVKLVNNANEAPVTLFINSDTLATAQTSIGPSGSLRTYNVTYAVNYVLRNAKGQLLVGPNSVSSQQSLTVMSNEVLENSNKLQDSKANLTRDVITKIMFQLSSKDTQNKLAKAIQS